MAPKPILDFISSPPPPPTVALEPYVTSHNILQYKSHAWSFLSNPRALENHYLIVYEDTLRDLLSPIQGGPYHIVAGQQHLWVGNVRPVQKKGLPRKTKKFKSTGDSAHAPIVHDQGSATSITVSEESNVHIGGDSGTETDVTVDVVEDDDHDVTDLGPLILGIEDEGETVPSAGISPNVEVKSPQEEDDKAETGSLTDSVATVDAIRRQYSSGVPDNTVIALKLSKMELPPSLLPTTTPFDDYSLDERRAHCNYVQFGGWTVEGYVPESHTELKRAGPFWRYAPIVREDCPWPEPGKQPHNHRALRHEFYDLFSNIYFEIGTVRSDHELTKIRQIYFMKATGILGYRLKAEAEVKDTGSSSKSGSSQSGNSQSKGTRAGGRRAGGGQVENDKAEDSKVLDGQAGSSQLKGSSTRMSTRSKGQK
ncbi:hypothetical protein EV368DRAFT_87096 [Lentinula lateritia]|nr:hypothetical protein EV368DRAFT_87096 [Lentinula lateritia]